MRREGSRQSPLLSLFHISTDLGLELLEPPRALLLEDFASRGDRGRVSRNDDQVDGRGARGELDVGGGGTSDDGRTPQRDGGGGDARRRRRRRRRCFRSRHGRTAGAQHGRGHSMKFGCGGHSPARREELAPRRGGQRGGGSGAWSEEKQVTDHAVSSRLFFPSVENFTLAFLPSTAPSFASKLRFGALSPSLLRRTNTHSSTNKRTVISTLQQSQALSPSSLSVCPFKI